MRSSPSARPAAVAAVAAVAVASRMIGALGALAALVALTACGSDTDPACDRSYLRYDNFGSPFIINWCRACHSAELPPDMRQQAPAGVDFDTLTEIRAWSRSIAFTTGDDRATMPPAGGPSSSERAMLVEWLRCGAR